MNEEKYIETQTMIATLAQLVADAPLAEFIAAIDRADNVGPLVDPTLWLRSNTRMSQFRDAAAALREFQRASAPLLQHG